MIVLREFIQGCSLKTLVKYESLKENNIKLVAKRILNLVATIPKTKKYDLQSIFMNTNIYFTQNAHIKVEFLFNLNFVGIILL